MSDISRKRRLTGEDKRLAKQIRIYRKKRNYSQLDLSMAIGANESYIAFIETGQRGLSLPYLYKIAKVLNVPLKTLFDF